MCGLVQLPVEGQQCYTHQLYAQVVDAERVGLETNVEQGILRGERVMMVVMVMDDGG